MKASIYFPAFAFLVLFALLLFFSDQFSRFSAPQSMLKSEREIDGTVLEEATSIDQEPATNRNSQSDPALLSTEFRGHFSALGLFSSPAEIRLLSDDPPAEASADIKLKESTRKLRRAETHIKNHAHTRHSK